MEILFLIFGFMIAAPIFKAIAERISSAPAQRGIPDGELRRELDQVAAQLHESNERLRAMETRLDFYEKLIEERPAPSTLPPADPGIIT